MSVLYTPHTWVTAEVVTAAEMNTEINTPFTGLQAAWTGYTPVLTAATTNPVLNNGTLIGRYQQYGKTIVGDFTLIWGSTSTVGAGQWVMSLPTSIATVTNRLLIFGLHAYDASAGKYEMGLAKQSYTGVNTVLLYAQTVGAAAPDMAAVDGTHPMAWATSDQLIGTFRYEAA